MVSRWHFDVIQRRHVGGHERGLAPLGFDQAGCLLTARGGAPADDDLRATLGDQ
jgi:hypothetical protein